MKNTPQGGIIGRLAELIVGKRGQSNEWTTRPAAERFVDFAKRSRARPPLD
jgi:hypothetical protein